LIEIAMEPRLVLTDAPTVSDVDVIGAGLNAFNDSVVGYADRSDLAVLIQDPATGATLGGISGRTFLGLLFIDLVYLPASMRGQDIGSRMMAMAEEEGRRRGCKAGVLYTISFQAPEFYRKLGWQVLGEIACDPPGTSRVFLTKRLD
jgi:GNAT superfamily N-acetyltransferase